MPRFKNKTPRYKRSITSHVAEFMALLFKLGGKRAVDEFIINMREHSMTGIYNKRTLSEQLLHYQNHGQWNKFRANYLILKHSFDWQRVPERNSFWVLLATKMRDYSYHET